MPVVEAPQDQWAEVRPILDEELSRLPDHYRAVIVLSDLEGKGRREVAAQLGCPEGTVASRLGRARSMLAKRLTRRGVALSGGVLATVLSQNASAVPPSVVMSTIKAVNHVPVKVAALAEGVLKAMLLTKLKSAMAVLLVAALVGLVGYGVARGMGDVPQEKGDAEQKVEAVVKEKAKKDAIAWGEEIDGLQMGLVADASTVRQGETLKLTVKLRNVGKAELTVTCAILRDCPPEITTDTGGRVRVYMPTPSSVIYSPPPLPMKRTLKPDETITLHNAGVAVQPEDPKMDGEVRPGTPTIFAKPGTYKVAYGGLLISHPKLSTGTVEVEVKEPAKPKDDVAWGKEVDGLQIGLVSDARAIQQGEKLKLTVKLRNVGKAKVTVT
jgi:hypothetical protein